MRSAHGMTLLGQVQSQTNDPVIEWIVMAIVFFVVIAFIGKKVADKTDRDWLPGLVIAGFAAKVAATLARFYMVEVYYGGGDSFSYHEAGRLFAPIWRAFAVPISNAGGEGTAFTEQVTGLLYAIYTPSMAGGFLMFAFIAYIGQVLFYVAFRPWMPAERQRLYGRVALLFPSMLFWPASVGKDSLMLLFIGIAMVGASRLLRTYRLSAWFLIAPGVFLTAQIRPHIAGFLMIALVLAALFGRPPAEYRSNPKRALMIAVSVFGVVFALATFATDFDVAIEDTRGAATQTPDDFLNQVSDRTEQGGSAVDGGAATSPLQLPGAIIKVLYRPLLHEGTNPQVLLSALEGTTLLVITIWKFPVIWRNKWLLRENPMMLMSFLYTGGFIVAFSAINNLGILARQRVQVLPMFLALLVSMTWDGHVRPSHKKPLPGAGPMELATKE